MNMDKKIDIKNKDTKDSCPYAKKCGSCQFQGIPYEKQLQKKQEMLQKLLGKHIHVHPVRGMKNPFNYRNKIHAAFGRTKNGQVISGIYEEKSHRIVNIDDCMIQDQLANRIVLEIRNLLKSFKIKTYDEDTQYGLLRHVLIRKGFATGEVLVILVLSSPILPSKNNFIKALRSKFPEITTVVLNVNDKKTSMVLGERNITLYGKGYIEDELCGLRYRISPSSFYQVNSVQTKVLYEKAIEYAKLTGKEIVFDAYCGIGTIGLTASKKARHVIGVELNKDAFRDAITNAKRNQVKNITFYNKDATAFMMEMAEKKEPVDVLFMDPPRSGSTPEFIEAAAKLAPKRIIYVSCGPDTLARDLVLFQKKGYVAKECQPVDLFPFTEHCEAVVPLVRKES